MGCNYLSLPLIHALAHSCWYQEFLVDSYYLLTAWWRHQMEAFVRGIYRSPANCPHKRQWGGALMFSLICARTNAWVNNRDASDLIRPRAHYDVTVMHILQGRTTGNGTIVYSPHGQWSYLEGYGIKSTIAQPYQNTRITNQLEIVWDKICCNFIFGV